MVNSIAIGIVGGLAENGDCTTAFVKPEDAVVGDIGPDEITTGGKPCRSFAPSGTNPQPFDPCMTYETLFKPLIKYLKAGAF